MPCRELSDNCIYVALNKYPACRRELTWVNTHADANPDKDIIIDYTRVEMLDSSSISNLLLLRDITQKNNRRLIFCHMPFTLKCELHACGLTELFNIVEDKPTALLAVSNS